MSSEHDDRLLLARLVVGFCALHCLEELAWPDDTRLHSYSNVNISAQSAVDGRPFFLPRHKGDRYPKTTELLFNRCQDLPIPFQLPSSMGFPFSGTSVPMRMVPYRSVPSFSSTWHYFGTISRVPDIPYGADGAIAPVPPGASGRIQDLGRIMVTRNYISQPAHLALWCFSVSQINLAATKEIPTWVWAKSGRQTRSMSTVNIQRRRQLLRHMTAMFDQSHKKIYLAFR